MSSAADRERIETITQRLIDGGCEHEVELCREQCDTFAEYCLPCQTDWLLSQLSALSEALSAVQRDLEVCRSIKERHHGDLGILLARAEKAEAALTACQQERQEVGDWLVQFTAKFVAQEADLTACLAQGEATKAELALAIHGYEDQIRLYYEMRADRDALRAQGEAMRAALEEIKRMAGSHTVPVHVGIHRLAAAALSSQTADTSTTTPKEQTYDTND